ncbi:MAG: hypothetical protein KIT27_08210 [Legionellales bacterium]|nr:hypothetical protein [Legionellales bacterium]
MIPRKLLLPALLTTSLITLPLLANAQDILTYLKNTAHAVTYLAKQLNPTLKFIQSQNYQAPKDAGKVISANMGMINAQTLVNQNVQNSLNQQVKNTLNNASFYTKLRDYMANIPDVDSPPKTISDADQQNSYNTAAPTNNFSVSSLLGTTYYNYFGKDTTLGQFPTSKDGFPDTKDQAMTFIMSLSGLSNPFQTVDYNSLYQSIPQQNGTNPNLAITQLQNSDAMKNYLLTMRSYAAMRSIALDNLLHMYYQRVPIQNLGQQAGIPESANPIAPNASLLQVDEYRASRRLTPEWYQEVNQEPPATVDRQILLVLAEMRYEQYEQRLATERLNATMSALLLSLTQTATGNTDSLRELRNQLSTTLNPNSNPTNVGGAQNMPTMNMN